MTDLTPARHPAARRTYHGLRAGAVLLAAAGAVGFTLLATGVANAVEAPKPRLVEGNVTTCAQAGLEGEIILQGGSGSASSAAGTGTVTGFELDVTINAGFTATGIAVKGGTNTNVYDGPFVGPTTVEGMVAPLNAGGQQSEISHWLVCGFKTPSSPPPSTPPSSAPESTPPTSPSSAAAGGAGGLPVTGASLVSIVAVGAGLILGGAGLVFLRRRRDLGSPS